MTILLAATVGLIVFVGIIIASIVSAGDVSTTPRQGETK